LPRKDLSVSTSAPTIEIVHHAPPGRLNEDAWLLMQNGPLGNRILFAAIDGATTRLNPPPLKQYLASLESGGSLTPAAYSARLVRDSLARLVAEGLFSDLRTLLLEANADLARDLIRHLGALTLEAMAFPPDVYAALAHDPRLVRLGLPASVATLAEYDPAAGEIRWAHVGDTMLLVAYQDGRVAVPTHPDVAVFDSEVKRNARKFRDNHAHLSYRELINSPEMRQQTVYNALYHNYVDEYGLPQPNHGIGVLDGLPELRYFIQTGRFFVDDVSFVCALTDGLEWPASLFEAFADDPAEAEQRRQDRLAHMAATLNASGLSGYLALLRQTEADDPNHENYPRFKTHDDATGILLRFGA